MPVFTFLCVKREHLGNNFLPKYSEEGNYFVEEVSEVPVFRYALKRSAYQP